MGPGPVNVEDATCGGEERRQGEPRLLGFRRGTELKCGDARLVGRHEEEHEGLMDLVGDGETREIDH